MTSRIWLPERRRLGALAARVPGLRRVLAQATRLPDALTGVAPLIADAFAGMPGRLPVAALTRRVDAPEDHAGRWVRVDPCHLRVEVSGVRMLACGAGLSLDADEAAALANTVRPLFEEAYWRFDASRLDRWYAQPPSGQARIGGQGPEDVLGAYIDAALPAGEAGRDTRRWLNELQMALHDHPVHRRRRERGQFEVNSLWLHGDGALDQRPECVLDAICSADPLLRGLAVAAGVAVGDALAPSASAWLLDARDGEPLIEEMVRALRSRVPMHLQLESGERFHWCPWHALRFWRREPA